MYEIIEIPEDTQIKLNEYGVKGYKLLNQHKITIDGKEIQLSEKSFEELKKSLNS